MSAECKKYEKILVAVDFSHEPKAVFSRACRIAENDGAQLKLIHCIPKIEEVFVNAYGMAGVPAAIDFQKFRDEAFESSQAALGELIAGESNKNITFLTVEGSPVDGIVGAATDFSADLIVVGSHGKHGIKLLLGSTASGVLHRAACDTLMVRV